MIEAVGVVIVVVLLLVWFAIWRVQTNSNRRAHFARTGQRTFRDSNAAFKARDYAQAEVISREEFARFPRPVEPNGLHGWHLSGLARFAALALVDKESEARSVGNEVLDSLSEALEAPEPTMRAELVKFRDTLVRLLDDVPLDKPVIHRWIVTGRI